MTNKLITNHHLKMTKPSNYGYSHGSTLSIASELPDRENEKQQQTGDDVVVEENVGILSPIVQENSGVQRVNVETQLYRLNDVVVQRYWLAH